MMANLSGSLNTGKPPHAGQRLPENTTDTQPAPTAYRPQSL